MHNLGWSDPSGTVLMTAHQAEGVGDPLSSSSSSHTHCVEMRLWPLASNQTTFFFFFLILLLSLSVIPMIHFVAKVLSF